jgi:hypothetical protein
VKKQLNLLLLNKIINNGPRLRGDGITGGKEASLAYLNLTYGEVSEGERQQARADLEEYCGLDTEGMVWIMDHLEKTAKGK